MPENLIGYGDAQIFPRSTNTAPDASGLTQALVTKKKADDEEKNRYVKGFSKTSGILPAHAGLVQNRMDELVKMSRDKEVNLKDLQLKGNELLTLIDQSKQQNEVFQQKQEAWNKNPEKDWQGLDDFSNAGVYDYDWGETPTGDMINQSAKWINDLFAKQPKPDYDTYLSSKAFPKGLPYATTERQTDESGLVTTNIDKVLDEDAIEARAEQLWMAAENGTNNFVEALAQDKQKNLVLAGYSQDDIDKNLKEVTKEHIKAVWRANAQTVDRDRQRQYDRGGAGAKPTEDAMMLRKGLLEKIASGNELGMLIGERWGGDVIETVKYDTSGKEGKLIINNGDFEIDLSEANRGGKRELNSIINARKGEQKMSYEDIEQLPDVADMPDAQTTDWDKVESDIDLLQSAITKDNIPAAQKLLRELGVKGDYDKAWTSFQGNDKLILDGTEIDLTKPEAREQIRKIIADNDKYFIEGKKQEAKQEEQSDVQTYSRADLLASGLWSEAQIDEAVKRGKIKLK